MSEKQILINNLEAHFKIAGQGPAVLVLHGWGASSDSWIKFQKALKDKKIIIPDLPGFGKSKTPLTPWSVDDYVSWLENFINLENIRDFVLLGHSFGGRVSIRFAAKHPEKINSLILCSSAGIKTKPDLKTKIIHYGAKIGNAFFNHPGNVGNVSGAGIKYGQSSPCIAFQPGRYFIFKRIPSSIAVRFL